MTSSSPGIAGESALNPTPPSTGGDDIPIADITDVVIDDTTYDNTVTGTGKLRTVVFPTDTVAFAFALVGDLFPRWLFLSDSGDGLYFGDGTFDPYNDDGANLYYNAGLQFSASKSGDTIGFSSDSMSFTSANSLSFNSLSGEVIINNLPDTDPHILGQLYTLAGALMVSAG